MRTRPRSQLRPRTGAAHSAPAHEKGESRPPRARATRLPSRAGPRDPYQNTRRVRHRHPHRQWPVAVASGSAARLPAHGQPRRGRAAAPNAPTRNRRARGALRIVVYEPATAVTPAWSGVFTCYSTGTSISTTLIVRTPACARRAGGEYSTAFCGERDPFPPASAPAAATEAYASIASFLHTPSATAMFATRSTRRVE